jgi:hypothetical protein
MPSDCDEVMMINPLSVLGRWIEFENEYEVARPDRPSPCAITTMHPRCPFDIDHTSALAVEFVDIFVFSVLLWASFFVQC